MRWRPRPAADEAPDGALAGVRVLELATLVPGPLATLLLADAGADVIKIEAPGGGDEMRAYRPRFGSTSANFALLNRGKRAVTLDLKSDRGRAALTELAADADVLVEQFRPGVADRLGFGWPELKAVNPRLVYCSITGYGQDGPRRRRAGHDLTYQAEAGMLDLCRDGDGAPSLPPALVADLAGGAYPAVMNILLALRQRDLTGRGCRLDIAMFDNLFPLMYWGLASGHADGSWPRPGGELVTGGSPRYRIYRTSDGRHLAVAPLEDRFWRRFCELVDLPERHRAADADPALATAAVAEVIAGRTAAQWNEVFDGEDVCVAEVRSLAEAVADPAVAARKLFERTVAEGDAVMPALPTPWSAALRDGRRSATYPDRSADLDE